MLIPGYKVYMEFTIDSGNPIFGIGTSAASLSNYVGSGTTGWGWQVASTSKVWHNGSNSLYSGAGDAVATDVVMVAVDIAAQKFWGGRNGTWHNSGNPGAGTGEAPFPTTAIPTSGGYLMGSINTAVTAITIRQTPTYTVPGEFIFVRGT